MVLCTLLWSIAGVVTRQLDAARGFEITFWRSLFAAFGLAVLLPATLGWRRVVDSIVHGGVRLWASGLCWAVMYTAFMLALSLTRVAIVLVVSAVGPLATALFGRVFLGQRLRWTGWAAIGAAGLGVAWMFGAPLLAPDVAANAAGPGAPVLGMRDLLGAALALLVPLAAATNWTLLQRDAEQRAPASAARRPGDGAAGGADRGLSLVPAVLVGAVLSSLATLPAALPLQAGAHDIGWLALLGVFQLALPCALVVPLTRWLPTAQIAMLGLLEILFGVLWAWWGAGERPLPSTLQGGAVVLASLVASQAVDGARARRPGVPAGRRPTGGPNIAPNAAADLGRDVDRGEPRGRAVVGGAAAGADAMAENARDGDEAVGARMLPTR